jgi:hypothetical protein
MIGYASPDAAPVVSDEVAALSSPPSWGRLDGLTRAVSEPTASP